jgi:hypothetical protein
MTNNKNHIYNSKHCKLHAIAPDSNFSQETKHHRGPKTLKKEERKGKISTPEINLTQALIISLQVHQICTNIYIYIYITLNNENCIYHLQFLEKQTTPRAKNSIESKKNRRMESTPECKFSRKRQSPHQHGL